MTQTELQKTTIAYVKARTMAKIYRNIRSDLIKACIKAHLDLCSGRYEPLCEFCKQRIHYHVSYHKESRTARMLYRKMDKLIKMMEEPMTLNLEKPQCPNPRCEDGHMVPVRIEAGAVVKWRCWHCGASVEPTFAQQRETELVETGQHLAYLMEGGKKDAT